MPLYFAYGSNMDAIAMARRCPASKLVGLARLERHRFIIMKEGYASVVRDSRATVWGVVWDLSLADVPALDRYEGVSGGLYVKAYQPVVTEGGVKRALVYLGCSSAAGLPRSGYIEGVLEAAQAARLPAAYMQELRSWARRARA